MLNQRLITSNPTKNSAVIALLIGVLNGEPQPSTSHQLKKKPGRQ
jgi:hypothetical protein